MSRNITGTNNPIKTGAGIGTVIGILLLPVAFLTAFAICADSTFASWLFPYAVIADPTLLFNQPVFALLLMLIQYPIYGIICGYVWKHKQSLPVVVVLILFAVHLIAIGGAAYRINHAHDNYPIEIR